jgi:hypothetical protein
MPSSGRAFGAAQRRPIRNKRGRAAVLLAIAANPGGDLRLEARGLAGVLDKCATFF